MLNNRDTALGRSSLRANPVSAIFKSGVVIG